MQPTARILHSWVGASTPWRVRMRGQRGTHVLRRESSALCLPCSARISGLRAQVLQCVSRAAVARSGRAGVLPSSLVAFLQRRQVRVVVHCRCLHADIEGAVRLTGVIRAWWSARQTSLAPVDATEDLCGSNGGSAVVPPAPRIGNDAGPYLLQSAVVHMRSRWLLCVSWVVVGADVWIAGHPRSVARVSAVVGRAEGHRAIQETVSEHGTLRAAAQKSNTHTKRY